MSMSMSTPLPTGGLVSKGGTKLDEVNPGSVVRVEPASGRFGETYEARVIEVKPEYGPTAIAALVLEHDGREELVLANGNHVITVVVDSGLARAALPPADAIRIQRKPEEGFAMRFTGDISSASAIIQWLAGKAALHYEAATDTAGPSLTLHRQLGNEYAQPGDYLVETNGTVRIVNAVSYGADYEVLPR